MPSPSLAQLVRKWHKTYSHKNQWEFFYFSKRDSYFEQDLSKGYLRYWKDDGFAIIVDHNHAYIGPRPDGGRPTGSTEFYSRYSDFKILAADPRFFPKLDRMMQFVVGSQKRHKEHIASFMKNEMDLLKQMLK